MDRGYWQREIARLDPEHDWHRIYYLAFHHEFPWDLNQALSFALYRTYAVPAIGRLLAATGEFDRDVQKRYDDTGLILATVLEDGFDSDTGRTALRRMNRMHGSYDISNDDLRYVLATFVVVPIRWMAELAWRPFDEAEKIAAAHYYRTLGRHMGITDIPTTHEGFTELLDAYEAEHFGFDPGGLAVSEATLALMGTFPPNHLLPRAVNRRFAFALMDEPLLDAFRYPHPTRFERTAARAGLRARGWFLRRRPPRMEPRFFRDLPQFRSYPDGYDIAGVGTFPAGCPVPAPRAPA